ncbi:MAG TPA: hypothetical protein VGL56_20330 [Fimbriimonadaceae bacterium]|jgi:hypothetical protein
MQWQIPCGAYTVTDICKRLTERTGIDHGIDADFRDYPIYLSVKGDNPQRVEKLTAAALRAKWEKVNHGVRLIHDPVDKDADFTEFKRQLVIALEKHPLKGLPARDLYDMNPGSVIRFGSPTNDLIKELPTMVAKPTNSPAEIRVRRFCYGMFEFFSQGFESDIKAFAENSQVNFDTLPADVSTLLGDDLKKPAGSPAEIAALKKAMANPGGFDTVGKDPTVAMFSVGFEHMGDAVSHDMAIALSDLSIFVLAESKETVGSVLGNFSAFDDWTVVDGAAVARVPAREILYPTQTKRTVLTQLLAANKEYGVLPFQDISTYVRTQRPGASETWADAMMLVTSHIALDESYIADYPFNIRLGDSLIDADWQLLRAGKPFPLSALSTPAQEQVMAILLQSRGRMEGTDPPLWPSLAPGDLILTPELVDEKVVVGWTSESAEIRDAHTSGLQYQMRREHLSAEPLYQPAMRKKLKLTIAGSPNDSIETGFSQVSLVEGSKAVPYRQLPKELMAEFQKGVDEEAAMKSGEQTASPP